MRCWGVAVVGAGAAGLAAAYEAAGAAGGVLLLEGGPKSGRKLLATGNGRCNLTNQAIDPAHYHGDTAEAWELLSAWPAGAVREWFWGLGLVTRSDGEGRVYPSSLQAAAVGKALCSACQAAGAETLWGFEVLRIEPVEKGYLLTARDGRQAQARRCVLACGGQASPQHATGSGYQLARSLGHSVTELSPSLAGLSVAEKLGPLKGTRCRCRAALCHKNQEVYGESGEVIFGDRSVSGICVMNAAARLRDLPAHSLYLRLDLAEAMSFGQLGDYLGQVRRQWPQRPASQLFAGLLNLRLGEELAKRLGFTHQRTLGSLGAGELDRAVQLVKGFTLPVKGPLGWEQAQVTAGGVPLKEVDRGTMESKKSPGLYLAGELLNVDGDCGGYNLHWAWASGITAGRASAV